MLVRPTFTKDVVVAADVVDVAVFVVVLAVFVVALRKPNN